jgi:hypothetical protein
VVVPVMEIRAMLVSMPDWFVLVRVRVPLVGWSFARMRVVMMTVVVSMPVRWEVRAWLCSCAWHCGQASLEAIGEERSPLRSTPPRSRSADEMFFEEQGREDRRRHGLDFAAGVEAPNNAAEMSPQRSGLVLLIGRSSGSSRIAQTTPEVRSC